VPMPVKWLYMLQSGSLVAPTASSGTTSQVTVAGATASNPIVGRIAFWTDDETCKINVNTASEGNFMDTPRTQGLTDFDLADFPTFANEYQRYPGHPAMTCLSSVLGFLFPVNHTLNATVTGNFGAVNFSGSATYAPYQPYFDMNPKLNLDSAGNQGSKAGTVNSGSTYPAPLTVRNDRLYSSVDEFLFQVPTTSGTRVPNPPSPVATGTLSSALMDETRFFLTANSRAPDVNLFNQPRVITWPVNTSTNSTYRTTFDQVMAFCGQIGMDSGSNALAYYFQRQRNDHPTNDLPATGATTGLGRNRMLMNYLDGLTSQAIPGFGGNFLSKYPNVSGGSTSPTERDQILTEIFDYIRCLNLIDQSGTTGSTPMTKPFAPAATGTNYSTTYAGTNGNGNITSGDILTTSAGAGQVVPIYDTATQTKGFGRFPTISEVSLIFIATGWNDGNGGLSTDINYTSLGTTGNNNIYVSNPSNPSGTVAWGFYCASPPVANVTSGTAPPWTNLAIPNGNTQVQAALLINFFDPSQGNVPENGTYSVQIVGLDKFQWAPTTGANAGVYKNMGFPGPSGASTACTSNMASEGSAQYAVNWGGNMGFRKFLAAESSTASATSYNYYPFVSAAANFPYTVDTKTPADTFNFQGGEITINMLLPSNTPPTPNWSSSVSGTWPLSANSLTPNRPPIQQITVSFPSATLPLPTYAPAAVNNSGAGNRQDRGNFNVRFQSSSNNYGANPEFTSHDSQLSSGTAVTGSYGDTVRSVRAYPGDIRMIAGKLSVSDSVTHPSTTGTAGYFDSGETKIMNSGSGMAAWNYGSTTTHMVHSLRESSDYPFAGARLGQLVPGFNYSGYATGTEYNNYSIGLFYFSAAGNNATAAGAFIGGGISGSPGDWDNGMGYAADGPYINKPDEGNYNFYYSVDGNIVPYFSASNYSSCNAVQTYFSPNRLMASPVMFGSLPTGVVRNIPWQTLLFCPNPPAGNNHPGFGTSASGGTGPSAFPPFAANAPPDHLLLDLFTMPVVEPYPISEPLSTAGRINMNYQIAPFSYIERNTGLRAVLKAERMTVIPDSAAGSYKTGGGTTFTVQTGYDFRVPINADETLKAFDYTFYNPTNPDIFRSASQICTMYMYPAKDAAVSGGANASLPTWNTDGSNTNINKFWNGTGATGYNVSTVGASPTHYLTGDNSRERIYATIYPRLTTKSNTYTVHMRVQTLKKTPGSSPTVWTEGSDQVLSEYRGSQTIERYVDPSDTKLPDFTTNTTTALDAFYKFRVLNTKKFSP